jgi:hypothetical protein
MRDPMTDADRPIQAGDWVECVDARGTAYLETGRRYEVAVSNYAGIVLANFQSRHAYDADRFKRVDGPHPESVPVVNADAQSSGAFEDTGEASVCRSCPSPATHGDYCVYCANETEGGCDSREHIDMVTMVQMREGKMSDGSPIRGELAARARLEAWSRAEKPRVRNTADQREFRKPHPWAEFDELESR